MPTFDRVVPLLVYENIPAAHDFLVKAFGFTSGGVVRDGDGKAVHGEVRAGDTTMWLHRSATEHGVDSPVATGLSNSGLVVHVDDVDAHCKNARETGAQIDNEPVDQPYGFREYGARDSEGHRWWFATPLSVASRK